MIGGIGIPELIILIPLFLLYFLPATMARSRKHKNRYMILFLNILIGWTGLGWFAISTRPFIEYLNITRLNSSHIDLTRMPS